MADSNLNEPKKMVLKTCFNVIKYILIVLVFLGFGFISLFSRLLFVWFVGDAITNQKPRCVFFWRVTRIRRRKLGFGIYIHIHITTFNRNNFLLLTSYSAKQTKKASQQNEQYKKKALLTTRWCIYDGERWFIINSLSLVNRNLE